MLVHVSGSSGSAVDRVARACAFSHFYGISRTPGLLLIALYEAAGDYRSAVQLAALTTSTPRSVQNHVCELRQALETEALDFEEGRGYRLTEIGLGECREAMRQMRESLAA